MNGKLPILIEENGTIFRIIIDEHYVIDQGGSLIIGVELKNIMGRLSGEQLTQLGRYDELIKSGEINKIEYVFSTKTAAEANLGEFITRFKNRLTKFDLKYIENGQIYALTK